MITHYTNTFIFSEDSSKVLLIKKNKPSWQKGRLNGIGGHVENGETPIEAAIREVKEECDISLDVNDMTHFCNLFSISWEMYCFSAFISIEKMEKFKSLTEETVQIYSIDIKDRPDLTIPNLSWMIPMALNSRNVGLFGHKEFYTIGEKESV